MSKSDSLTFPITLAAIGAAIFIWMFVLLPSEKKAFIDTFRQGINLIGQQVETAQGAEDSEIMNYTPDPKQEWDWERYQAELDKIAPGYNLPPLSNKNSAASNVGNAGKTAGEVARGIEVKQVAPGVVSVQKEQVEQACTFNGALNQECFDQQILHPLPEDPAYIHPSAYKPAVQPAPTVGPQWVDVVAPTAIPVAPGPAAPRRVNPAWENPLIPAPVQQAVGVPNPIQPTAAPQQPVQPPPIVKEVQEATQGDFGGWQMGMGNLGLEGANPAVCGVNVSC